MILTWLLAGVVVVIAWDVRRLRSEVAALRGRSRAHRETLCNILAWARKQGATVNFRKRGDDDETD